MRIAMQKRSLRPHYLNSLFVRYGHPLISLQKSWGLLVLTLLIQ